MALTIIKLMQNGKTKYSFSVDPDTVAMIEQSEANAAWGMSRVLEVLNKKTYAEKVMGILQELIAYRKSDEEINISGMAFRDYTLKGFTQESPAQAIGDQIKEGQYPK